MVESEKPMFKLSESKEALQHRTEFAVKQYNGLVCLDYIVCFPGTFDSTEEEVVAHAALLLQNGVQPDLVRAQAEKEVARFAQSSGRDGHRLSVYDDGLFLAYS